MLHLVLMIAKKLEHFLLTAHARRKHFLRNRRQFFKASCVKFHDCRARNTDNVNVTVPIFELTENFTIKEKKTKKNVEKRSRETDFANRNIL